MYVAKALLYTKQA